MELTDKHIQRQDFVDNAIFHLIQEVNPSRDEIDWDIEFIGRIRDIIQDRLAELNACSPEVFYPSVEG